MKKNRRIVHIHTPLLEEPQRPQISNACQLRFKNRRVIFKVYPNDYVLMFKSLLDGKVMVTTVPLSREALAAIVAIYESLPDARREADLELLQERFLPARGPMVRIIEAPTGAGRGDTNG